MGTIYIFDSNVFISLQRRQPIDVYPSVWEKIGDLMKDGVIISSREVFDEIAIGDDTLVEWVKQRKEYFIQSEVNLQSRVREILKEHRGLVEGGKKKNNADPFVIALAQEYDGIIVTEETRSNSIQAPKIPNVCDEYHIVCLDFVGFSRKMRLAF
ncbi:MAG: DUF4411 family protein [Clostridia bacterium]